MGIFDSFINAASAPVQNTVASSLGSDYKAPGTDLNAPMTAIGEAGALTAAVVGGNALAGSLSTTAGTTAGVDTAATTGNSMLSGLSKWATSAPGLQGILGVLGGVLSGGKGGPNAGQAQSMVDPFAPYRAAAGAQLSNLMQNPASVSQQPGWQASQAAGEQAVQRQASATGQGLSGNEQIALQNQGMSQQNSWFNNLFSQLSTLSGASAGPAAGGQAGVGAANTQAQTQGANLGAVANVLGQGISAAMSGSPQSAANTNNVLGYVNTSMSGQ